VANHHVTRARFVSQVASGADISDQEVLGLKETILRLTAQVQAQQTALASSQVPRPAPTTGPTNRVLPHTPPPSLGHPLPSACCVACALLESTVPNIMAAQQKDPWRVGKSACTCGNNRRWGTKLNMLKKVSVEVAKWKRDDESTDQALRRLSVAHKVASNRTHGITTRGAGAFELKLATAWNAFTGVITQLPLTGQRKGRCSLLVQRFHELLRSETPQEAVHHCPCTRCVAAADASVQAS
jgi:hypothetical protein